MGTAIRPGSDAAQVQAVLDRGGPGSYYFETGHYTFDSMVNVLHSDVTLAFEAGVVIYQRAAAPVFNVQGSDKHGHEVWEYIEDDKAPYTPVSAKHGEIARAASEAWDVYKAARIELVPVNVGFRMVGSPTLMGGTAGVRLHRAASADVMGPRFRGCTRGVQVSDSAGVRVSHIEAFHDGSNPANQVYGVTSVKTVGLTVTESNFRHLRHAVDFSTWSHNVTAQACMARHMTSWCFGTHPDVTDIVIVGNTMADAPGGISIGQNWKNAIVRPNLFQRVGYEVWMRGDQREDGKSWL